MSEPTCIDRAVEAIVFNLADRSGLGDEWEQIDPVTQLEIKATWALIIAREAKR